VVAEVWGAERACDEFNSEVKLCLEEIEPDHREAVEQAWGKAEAEVVVVGWEATGPEPAPVGTAYARDAEQKRPIK
jgi:hypothetical protein